ncbi:TetR/AcrR family transcriptional regulator [Corynebacterium sp. S7]
MRRDARDNRDTIIATARRMFSHGDAGASMRAVAREAGLGIATLTRHFPTRNDLVLAVLNDAVQDIEEVVDEYFPKLDAEPKKFWRETVFAISELEIAALGQGMIGLFELDHGTGEALNLLEDSEKSSLLAMVNRLEKAYERLLMPAKRAGLVDKNLEPLRFHLGLVATSRPLPKTTTEVLPGASRWLIEVYLDGLEHQADHI